MRHNPKGFTLVELMVVVTIIVILISVLLPAMEGAMTQAQIARCATNMDAIATGSVTYALDNKGVLFIARARGITISFGRLGDNAFDPNPSASYKNRPEDLLVDWPAALATVGLAGATKTLVAPNLVENPPSKVWDCPSRTYTSGWVADGKSLITTYQYFGGIERWTNAEGQRESVSPIRIGDGAGRMMLVADYTTKWAGAWGPSTGVKWIDDTPPHRRGPDKRPAGHNQAYTDGSAEWVPADKLIYIHDWYGGSYDYPIYTYQDNLGDYTPSDAMYLKNN